MRLKTVMATILTTAVALSAFAVPAAGMHVNAAGKGAGVYTNNQAGGIPDVNMQTSPETVELYAGLSWELLEADNVSVRLNVTDSNCGPVAKRSLNRMAAVLGASEVKTVDMDLETYLRDSGWSADIVETGSPIRVCIVLPEGSDPTKDYAVLSLRGDGVVEVLGDLDPDPATVTVDSDYFDTFMIVAAPAGTFDAYRVASPNALDKPGTPVYVKKIGSTIDAVADAHNIYSLGVLTDAATVRAAAGGQNVTLEMKKVTPGSSAKYALDNAINRTNASSKVRTVKTEDGKDKEEGPAYYELEMKNGAGQRISSTNGKLRITMTVPYNYPAYADYAVAVLNMDGTVSIMKDLDDNESTITIDTDQFRTYVFLWGEKGAFDDLP